MNTGVPMVTPCFVARGRVFKLAMPKSRSLTVPSSGDENIARLDVAMDDPRIVCRRQDVQQLSHHREELSEGQRYVRLQALVEGLPFEEVHDQEDQALRGLPVVENRSGPRVMDAVGHVSFVDEPPSEIGIARQLGVKDLDRHPLAVAMRGGVHRGRAADPDERIESPSSIQAFAHSGGRATIQFVVEGMVLPKPPS